LMHFLKRSDVQFAFSVYSRVQMRNLPIVICLLLMALMACSRAQAFNVTTLGLTPGQCVQASGLISIAVSGCSGRTNIITISANSTLTNSECGSLLISDGAGKWKLTLPSSPLANCEFTFNPQLSGFYL